MNDLFRKTQEEQETIRRLRLSQTPTYIQELTRKVELLDYKLNIILEKVNLSCRQRKDL